MQQHIFSESFFQGKKTDVLNSMASCGQYKYKRYRGIPIRYAGGKSRAVGHIIENLPYTKKLVSPFFGGGAVEFALAKEFGMDVVGYDIFDILVNYWQVQLKLPHKLADRILAWRPDDATYKTVKQTLKQHWRNESKITDAVELAAHYWFNHNLSYGPGFLGWMSGIYKDEHKFLRAVERVRGFRADKVRVKHGSFERTIAKHQEDFLYCDPPYFLDGDSKMFRGIYPQRNFPVHHNNFDHVRLATLLSQHKGGFILSYNDCTAVRELYKGCRIMKVEWQYTLGQGETRIGFNRIEAGIDNVKKSHELLIVKDRC